MVQKFVALGDSFTEGVGDVDLERPNQVRGWADRVAEVLCAEGDWQYANLAVRGKKIGQVINQQLDAALALRPDVVTLYAGGNDILRPSVDMDALLGGYAGMVRRLRACGAQVVLFTGFDTVDSPLFSKTRPRTAVYNELVRAMADDYGALLADYWRWREFSDLRYWAVDRLHMNEAGHTLMAQKVLGVLAQAGIVAPELPGRIQPPQLAEPAVNTRGQRLREDLGWAREHLVPWVQRRLRGTSSGDRLGARYPEYVRLSG
ncbi:SGNH/GDSL hydrolase family protein [Glutamicibacter sp. PS]|uniref:SGNH/GDSL hydrolase family protein n=1 Tax=Glutamicibacter sp. PS TaxID=3075634 RepID=UPI00283FBCEB|nr:SGNH/GDSL hydrolase family protein [Glutamicibacter sp. PS]MDR4531932.1 SGNH/GDSL hydrolase family protein [Glutamicibacter sp. PS]